MQKILLIGWCVLTVACSGTTTTSPTPVPTPTPVPPVPSSYTITGMATATNGGQPLSGSSIATTAMTTTITTTGAFSLTGPVGAVSVPLTLQGPTILTRVVYASPSSHAVTLSAFLIGPSFDLGYFRRIARDGFDSPSGLQPIRHLPGAPMVYLRTIDDAGVPIDATTLNVTENTIRSTGSAWTGGLFGIAGVERGTDTRERVPGWLTIRWVETAPSTFCGVSNVAVDGGVIRLNYLLPACHCGGSRIEPATIRHELGHAFGLYHTGDVSELMSGLGNQSGRCDLLPSAREQLYAGYLYSRPIGNADPDTDPASVVNLTPLTVR